MNLGLEEVLKDIDPNITLLRQSIANITISEILKSSSSIALQLPDINFRKNIEEKINIEGPESLADEALKIFRDINSEILDRQSLLEKNIAYLNRKLTGKSPLNEYREILLDAENGLSRDLDSFFGIITIYRSGIFSRNVREETDKLGLAKELKRLENQELSEDDKTLKKQAANDKIFPSKSILLSSFSQSILDLDSACMQLKRDFDELKRVDFGDSVPSSIDWSSAEIRPVISDLKNNIESRVFSLQQKVNRKIQSNVSSALQRWSKDLNAAKTNRKLYFSSVFLGTALFSILGYMIYVNFRDVNVSDNILSVASLGILVNIISHVIMLPLAIIFDGFSKNTRVNETQILEEFRAKSLQDIDDEISSFKLMNTENNSSDSIEDSSYENLSRSVSSYWKKHLLDESEKKYFASIELEYLKLRKLGVDFSDLLDIYSQHIEELTSKVSSYFSETEDNLEGLREIADELKSQSVYPSFDLLAKTRDTLREVKDKIVEIGFL